MSKTIAGVTLILCILFPSVADGQMNYAVRDLGAIGNNSPRKENFSSVEASLPFRINNESQAVFQGSGRAQLWLRFNDTDINLGAGVHDLSELDGTNDTSIALDINEGTEIAGGIGSAGSEAAVVWMFDAQGDITRTIIDFSGSDFGGTNSRAHGINEGDPPYITGFCELSEEGVCDEVPLPRPFQTIFGLEEENRDKLEACLEALELMEQ